MIDRSLTPEIKTIDKIDFVTPEIVTLGPDTKSYWISAVQNETARVELHFDAGSIRGDKKYASFTNSLLLAGTDRMSHVEILERFNELGAYTDQECGQESALVSLYCLNENLEASLNLILDCVEHANFPASEANDLLRERKQNFMVANEKVSHLVRRKFQNLLFQSSNEYSRLLEANDYDEIDLDKIKEFHHSYYLKGLRKIVIVSACPRTIVDDLHKRLSTWSNIHQTVFAENFEYKPELVHVQKDKAIQTAIRIGYPLFNKENPEFVHFQILQTILGDYFGSRLMSNIREDKGYTYGIGSGLIEMMKTGYFIIATEVASEFTEATMHEIQVELKRLQDELIPQEELDLVKNYLLGQILKNADGPNAMMNMYLGVEANNYDLSYYNEVIAQLQSVTAEELQALAQKYLNWEQMLIVTAGDLTPNDSL